jgi:hypothetical protein
MISDAQILDYADGNGYWHYPIQELATELLSARTTIAELENAWLIDENIQADGSLRPSISTTIHRYETTIATLTEQLKAAEEDAERLYECGLHSDHCDYFKTVIDEDCSCGWTDASRVHRSLIRQHEARKQG